MRNFTLLLALCALPLGSLAEKGQSIMFGDQDPLYSDSATTSPAKEKADHCSNLRRQMDELKGKPQSRNAVVQQYQLECQQNQQDQILLQHEGSGSLF